MQSLPTLLQTGALAAAISGLLYSATITTAALTALFTRNSTRRSIAQHVLKILIYRPHNKRRWRGRKVHPYQQCELASSRLRIARAKAQCPINHINNSLAREGPPQAATETTPSTGRVRPPRARRGRRSAVSRRAVPPPAPGPRPVRPPRRKPLHPQSPGASWPDRRQPARYLNPPPSASAENKA
jgi:hypothetical protein